MARGFLAGAAWGGIVSVVGVGIVSVAGDGPFLRQPEPVVDAPLAGQAAPDAQTSAGPGVAPDTAPAAAAQSTPAPDADAPDTLAALAEEARDPGSAPAAGNAGAAPSAPQEGASGALPDQDSAPARSAQPESAPAASGQDAPATAPAAPAGTTDVGSAAPELASPGAAGSAGQAQSAGAEDAPLPAPRPALPAADTADAAPDADASPAEPPAPEVTARAQPDSDSDASRPGIGTPAQSLASASSARLPRVGGAAEADAGAGAEATSAGEDARPVMLYAEPIEIASDRPLMSIVLIDDGTGAVGPEVLDGFPYPVTVAVDPTSDTALQRASAYRALGLEVMVLGSVPDGAQAQDVEVNLAARLSAVPEAVGVLESADAGLQRSRAVSDQVAAILSQTGHGLVLFPKGLNAAATQAAKSGVPAATVFRDFDGKGQDPKVMRRFLDQAAFKARQDDGVVMVGRLAPDTVSALLLWGLQDRAAQVGLVPVSMVLGAEADG